MLSTLPSPLFASLSITAQPVFQIGPFPVTNSMIASIIVCVIIIAIASYACRQIRLVPRDEQNVWEVIVEWLLALCEPILGEKGAQRTFWFFAAIFIFIVSANLLALFPGTGSIGYITANSPTVAAEAQEEIKWYNVGPEVVAHGTHGEAEAHGAVVENADAHAHDHGMEGVTFTPFLRGSNADTNMVFAMAIWFMVFWLYWSISELGFVGFIHHIFGPKAKVGGKGALGIFIGAFFIAIFIFVGLIEVISILFRPISLAFRLFGNIYGGEAMLESLYLETGSWWLASIVMIPAYLFELLVAVVQALVFCLLTAAFTGTMIKHEEHHGAGDSHGDAETAH